MTASDNPNVSERTPDAPVRLEEIGRSLLDEARSNSDGRAAVTLTPSTGGPLKQTLVAVATGQRLDPERWNGRASLQVLSGAARIAEDGEDHEVPAGCWSPITSDRAEISAAADLVALVTVAPPA